MLLHVMYRVMCDVTVEGLSKFLTEEMATEASNLGNYLYYCGYVW